MGMPLSGEAQSVLRRNRAVLAAVAAAAIAIGGSCYAVYRLQNVLHGMNEQRRTADDLSYDGGDTWRPSRNQERE